MAIWLIGMQLYFSRRFFYYQESGLQRDLVCNFITRSQFDGQVLSELTLTKDLLMAKLHGPALRHLGITEAALIHSDASEYPHTRAWAEKIHASVPKVQGLKWDSKQAGGPAYMIFGDRVDENVFSISTPGMLLTESTEAVERIQYLVDEMGVQLVDPDTPDTE